MNLLRADGTPFPSNEQPEPRARKTRHIFLGIGVGAVAFLVGLLSTLWIGAIGFTSGALGLLAAVVSPATWGGTRARAALVAGGLTFALLMGAVVGHELHGRAMHKKVEKELSESVRVAAQQIFAYNELARETSLFVPNTASDLSDLIMSEPFAGIDEANSVTNNRRLWQVGGAAVRFEVFNGGTETLRLVGADVITTPDALPAGAVFIGSPKGGASRPPETVYIDLSRDAVPRNERGAPYFSSHNVTISPGENEVFVVKILPGDSPQSLSLIIHVEKGAQKREIRLPDSGPLVRVVGYCSVQPSPGYERVIDEDGRYMFKALTQESFDIMAGCRR